MAFVTGLATGNTLVVQAWNSKFHRESDDRNFFVQSGLRANDTGNEPTFDRRPSAPIMVQEALNNKRAQQVHVGLQMNLTRNHTAGLVRITDASTTVGINQYTYGTTSMVDSEEVPSLNSMTAWTEQMKHATGFDTPDVQDLRTQLKMTAQAANRLIDWFTVEREESIHDAILHKFSAHVVGGLTQTPVAPINALQGARRSSVAEVSSSDRLTAAELRRLFTWAEVNNINPISAGKGKTGFVLLVHPYCFNDLWDDEEFRNYHAQGNVRGTGNPAFDMADHEFGGIYLWKYNRIRTPATGDDAGNKRRNILLGADAVAEGVSMRPKLVVRKEDKYEDYYGLGVKGINGAARADWAPVSGTTFNQSSAVCTYWTSDAA